MLRTLIVFSSERMGEHNGDGDAELCIEEVLQVGAREVYLELIRGCIKKRHYGAKNHIDEVPDESNTIWASQCQARRKGMLLQNGGHA